MKPNRMVCSAERNGTGSSDLNRRAARIADPAARNDNADEGKQEHMSGEGVDYGPLAG